MSQERLIYLTCTVCGSRNYQSKKNKKNTPARVEFKKFCKKCKKVTLHKEDK